ncbi:MAG: hypothetical protein FWH59_01840 [Lentimicrobiaceae bacterium]|nr:hypothetical protein [Lentimicrobiaceae bacterium]
MNKNNVKIDPIFRYYLSNGFKHSLQAVAASVGISKKTLFNRYISKVNLERSLIEYWQKKTCDRFLIRTEFSNNAVEKLLMFLFELQYCKKNEFFFFQKNQEAFIEQYEHESPFIEQLEKIIKLGIKEELFRIDTDIKVFAYFFIFNTLFLLLSDRFLYTEYIPFLFAPILSETGKIVFFEVDIEQFFKQN